MAKRQNNVLKFLEGERYLVWTVVFILVVGAGLFTEITRAKAEMDMEMSTAIFLINNHHNKK
ncbi:MAG: hypothetical protein KW804_01385 [Candidatus Doudnabacteria bacterium]|nr:hypothetical protein [Candidatus Doudnabacteria bacterium]